MQRFILSGAVHALRNAAIARATTNRAASAIKRGHSAATTAAAPATNPRGTRSFSAAAAAPAAPSPSSAASASPVLSSLPSDLQSLASGVLSGDRLCLSRAITLVESSHPRHIVQAQQLLDALAKEKQRKHRAEVTAAAAAAASHADTAATPAPPAALSKAEADAQALRRPRSIRIGISGPPGVGKSTFIECLGQYLLGLGHRLAVLSIDPSSHLTGGSILGDKTRMLELSRNDNAYVRPSPSKCVLGGVGAHTFDAILLAEHAGFSTVLIETVGVGQSEVSVSDMVDLLLLIVQPGGGDELQGMKKGIVELIDLIVVNKADGALEANARHTKLEYLHALQLNTRRKADTDWKPQVKLCSSVQETAGHIEPQTTADTAAASAASSSPAASAAAAAPLSPRAKQLAQLQDIWLSIGAFDDWSKGAFGDFHLRRARQSKALLLQAVRENAFARITHALPSLRGFQNVQAKLDHQANRAGHEDEAAESGGNAHAMESSSDRSNSTEVIPRVAAQRIVDEWIAKEAEQVRAQNKNSAEDKSDSSSSNNASARS